MCKMFNILRKVSRFQKILALSEEFFSTVRIRNATGRDMRPQNPRLHREVYAMLRLGSRPSDNYRWPMITICR